MEKHSNNAVCMTSLVVIHPNCESLAVKKLNFLVLFLSPNATVMIWASQMLVRQVPCLDSMRMSSSLKKYTVPGFPVCNLHFKPSEKR